MPFFTRLEDYVHQRALSRYRSTNLDKVGDNHFQTIRSIGIVFDATNVDVREAVVQFSDDLRYKHKKVWLMGYFNIRLDKVNFPFDYVARNHLKFGHRPAGEQIQQFISEPFDVLINLDRASHKPVNYICAASRALFKIGPAHGDPAHYDLMIGMHKGGIAQYIEEIRKTFNRISG